MTYEEKRATVAFAILEASELAVGDEDIDFTSSRPPLSGVYDDDIIKILRQFEHQGLIEYQDVNFLGTTYFRVRMLNRDALNQFAKEFRPFEAEEDQQQETGWLIEYRNRKVLLNGLELSKTNFDSENDLVFQYLYDHPNQEFAKKDLETALNIKIKKDFSKIVENLGFVKGLRKHFFDISKDKIKFKQSTPNKPK